MPVTRNDSERKDSLFYVLGAMSVIAIAGVALGAVWLMHRYATSDTMIIPLKEYSSAEYPEDPADKSVNYGRYSDRRLKLVERDATHFDFVLEPKHGHVATDVFRNIDVSLMTPGEPSWTKRDPNLERIALTDRQWNRQQVSFARGSEHLEVSGGSGFERDNLTEADLAKKVTRPSKRTSVVHPSLHLPTHPSTSFILPISIDLCRASLGRCGLVAWIALRGKGSETVDKIEVDGCAFRQVVCRQHSPGAATRDRSNQIDS